ncbi:hypothetical protein [Mucilaginibacter humi]|uniref:hypothetical protein n=1 Tax=Mucilaginibacter humi TaxID=2732510 RepID=UPI001FE79DBE|nr:hypothetical protein [Mucilaginibacter humi]
MSLANIRQSTANAQKLTSDLNGLVSQINEELIAGKGSLHLLLRDSVAAKHIRKSLNNIEQGTDGFNQNMEALKHNFLFKGFFKDQAKRRRPLRIHDRAKLS